MGKCFAILVISIFNPFFFKKKGLLIEYTSAFVIRNASQLLGKPAPVLPQKEINH